MNAYPAIVLGTVDGRHKYKRVSITITSGENDEYYIHVFNSIKSSCLLFLRFNFEPKYATPDSAGAIHNAMEEVFPGIKIAKCWAHLMRAFPKYKTTKFSSERRYDEFVGDVYKLHSFNCDETFQYARALFNTKWKRRTNEKAAFVWFSENWFTDETCRWYVGATSPGLQIVNNPQERGN